jgi:hypothetical protein
MAMLARIRPISCTACGSGWGPLQKLLLPAGCHEAESVLSCCSVLGRFPAEPVLPVAAVLGPCVC